MRRRSIWLLALGVACLTVSVGQAGAGLVTLGQTGTPGANLGAGIYVQPAVAGGKSYTVAPYGKWMIKTWSTRAGSAGGHMAVVVLRPSSSANHYKVVNVTETKSLTPNALNTFRTQTRTKRNDLIGLWADADAAALFTTSNSGDGGFRLAASQPPSPGASVAINSPYTGYRTNLSVALMQGRGS